jgi:hypothetical protein
VDVSDEGDHRDAAVGEPTDGGGDGRFVGRLEQNPVRGPAARADPVQGRHRVVDVGMLAEPEPCPQGGGSR